GTNADWLQQAAVRAPISSSRSSPPHIIGRIACQSPRRASSKAQLSRSPERLPSALLLGFALAARALDRGAEDIAKAGARIGGPELSHGPFLFVHLTRLDRQRQFSRRAVDRGDLGVDFFANREAVGTLLAAVAREFRLADEAGHAIADHD